MINKKQLKRKLFIFLICLLLTIPIFPHVISENDYYSNIGEKNSKQPFNNLKEPDIVEKNIIIAPPCFYNSAKELEEFHDSRGISTVVINTTWISVNYDESPNPPFNGYANRIIPRLFIKRYEFNLAKKIINFLRDSNAHPNLEYVTIFGNAEFVPPSYYIHSPGRTSKRIFLLLPFPDIYNNIVATDFFYTSPDYDLFPDYKVGRLPVSNENEAHFIVEKIKDWRENVDLEWFQNIYVSGDQPDHPEEMTLKGCYAGEMIAVDAINQNFFQDMNITKLFWTEGKFNKASILDTLEEGNAGFMYMMAHGFVDRWGTYQEADPYIYADNLLAFPKNNNIPVIVSVACMSGAYDTNLASPYNLKRGTTSFGEAVLLSKGAGIAYIGTTRATLGSPLVYLERGSLFITKERGIAGMLTYLFEAYHNGTYILGDLVNKAIEKYIIENSFPIRPERDNDFIVLASFVLLGDPALDIPFFSAVIGNPSYSTPEIIALYPEGYTYEEHSRPWYYTGSEITLFIESDSPTVNVKRIDIQKDEVVNREIYIPEDNMFYYTFTTDEATDYLIRAESDDGKESWIYITTIEQEIIS